MAVGCMVKGWAFALQLGREGWLAAHAYMVHVRTWCMYVNGLCARTTAAYMHDIAGYLRIKMWVCSSGHIMLGLRIMLCCGCAVLWVGGLGDGEGAGCGLPL